MTDLPLDVRDEASQAAREAMYIQTGTRITQNMAEALVDAVVAVVTPQIARPLQARIAELEGALKFIAEDVCTGPSWVKTNCLNEFPSGLCPVCYARAVLAKGAPDVGEETP